MTTLAEVVGLAPDLEVVELQVGPMLMFGVCMKDGSMLYTPANQPPQAVVAFFRKYAL